MRLAWIIFKKDVRRLWWEAAVTLGLLAALVQMDAKRADFIPGSMEGLLNVLLPAAWMYLVALAVHQEPLVGDRQFWITRPYPRLALLIAKVLFVLAFIHLPSLLGDAVIVSVHGFSPLRHLPSLLAKQVLVAGAVTLPAAALAAVTRNITQFVLGAVVVAGAAIYLIGMVEPFSAPWISPDSVRWGAALALLALAACVIVFAQYTRRRTALSRTLGVGAVSTAALLFVFLPANYTAAVRCTLSPQTDTRPLSIDFAPERKATFPFGRTRRGFGQLAIPVAINGIPEGAHVRFAPLTFEIAGKNGQRWSQARPVGEWRNETEIVFATLWAGEERNAGWQVVRLDRSLYEKAGARVTINGTVLGTFYRERDPVRVGIEAGANAVPGVGRCSSVLVESRMGEEMLKVLCESPASLPAVTKVTLREPGSGREWNQTLGDSMPYVAYAHVTWLSPLNRRQTFFHLIEQRPTDLGSRWLVPHDALSHAELLVVPEQVTGRAIVGYQLRGVPLREFDK